MPRLLALALILSTLWWQSAVAAERKVPSEPLMRVVMAFASSQSGLPALEGGLLPKVALAPREELHAIYRPGVPYDPEAPLIITALYLKPPTGGLGGVILLEDGWLPHSDKHLAVLVHEMVHVLQYAAGKDQTAPCLRHLERAAFEAQQQFLRALGYDDPFNEMDTGPLATILLSQCSRDEMGGWGGGP